MRRFIYLDTDTLNSYIAQICDGLIHEEEIESQTKKDSAVHTIVSPEIEIDTDLKVLKKGIDGKVSMSYEKLKKTENTELIKDVQTKILHDNAFNHLVYYLTEKKLVNTSDDIGSFIEVKDFFNICDLDYFIRLFEEKIFFEFMKDSEKSKIKNELKPLQDEELKIDGANINLVNRKYIEIYQKRSKDIDGTYEELKKLLVLLNTIIPYGRTMLVSNNMVVLNDKYMRDNIEMTSFKYGGKINLLGYITNRINSENQKENTSTLSSILDVVNQMMLHLLGGFNELNIVHPIAIYYE